LKNLSTTKRCLVGVFAFATHVALANPVQSDSLDWLFPVDSSAQAAPSWDKVQPLSLDHSRVHLTQAQLNDLFNAPDWFPDTHSAMPDVVVHGRKPDVVACAFCHTPSGQGRPENAAIAGLSASYIARQLDDLRSGARKEVGPRVYKPVQAMAKIARQLTDEEIRVAADYFSKQSLRTRVRVEEAERISCVRPAFWVYVKNSASCTEDLGSRVIEVAPNPERHERRDETLVYIAYVPVRSIERGRSLSHDASPAHACSACHGEDLLGTDLAPPLAGRSPTYLLRQLVAFQSRTRQGERAVLMQPVIDSMSMTDMIAAVAYAASLNP
jgi:cytochrome c553